MLMFPEGGFLMLTYRFRASRFSERELNTHLLVALLATDAKIFQTQTQTKIL